MKGKSIVNLLAIFAALALLWIYSEDLLTDYRYLIYGRKTIATITELRDRNQENGSYVIEISYYNNYQKSKVDCQLNINPRFRKHLIEESANQTEVVYTKGDACDIYLLGNQVYRHPNVGGVLIHVSVFVLILFGTFLFIKKLVTEW